MNVWIVSSVHHELAEHVVWGVWSSHGAAMSALAECEADRRTVRCYLSHSVVDDRDAF